MAKSFWDYINDNGGAVEEEILGHFDQPNIVIAAKAMKKRDEIRVYDKDGKLIARDEDELAEYFYTEFNIEIHFCDYCGGILQNGMTNDDGDFYVHEGCFPDYMDEAYGRGKWMELGNGEEDGCGGYYITTSDVAGGYEATGIYYTEYY